MDFERISKASSFTFGGTTTAQEPLRTFKNAYASQFHKNQAYSSAENHHYSIYGSNNGTAATAQFHPKASTGNNNNNSSNALINITTGPNHFISSYPRQRYTPYHKRSHANASMQANQRGYQSYLSQQQYQLVSEYDNALAAAKGSQLSAAISSDANTNQSMALNSSNGTAMTSSGTAALSTNATSQDLSGVSGQENSSFVTLQISNLDSTLDEHVLKQQLISKLKPITSVISIHFEAISVAKIKLPSAQHAKQVVAFLHRKKIGHKRITVSYTRESSSMEPSTLRCQVVGILKVSSNSFAFPRFASLFCSILEFPRICCCCFSLYRRTFRTTSCQCSNFAKYSNRVSKRQSVSSICTK